MSKDINTTKNSNSSTNKTTEKNTQTTLSKQHLTAVFIDYENIYCSLLREFTNVIHINFFPKLSLWCKKTGRKLCKKIAYCNFDYIDLSTSRHQTLLNSLGMLSIHTSNNGKNCADLQIAIDVMECMHNYPEIEEYIIISNDKDMIPVLDSIIMHGKIATAITVGDKYDEIVENYTTNHLSLNTILKETAPNHLLEKTSECIVTYLEDTLKKQIHTHDCKTESFYTLDRLLSIFSKRYRIMTYEIANILKVLYATGEICFAEYHDNDKSYITVIPNSMKAEIIGSKLIKKKDIKSDFDIDSTINAEYLKAQKHLSA